MRLSKTVILSLGVILFASCDSDESPTLGFLTMEGGTDGGSEDWIYEDCELDDGITACRNPAQYSVKFIRVIPYACGSTFVELCDESAGLSGVNQELGGYGSLAPDVMTMIPYGTGFSEGRPLGGVPLTAGGILLMYNYVEAEVPTTGQKVRACYNPECGGIDGAQIGDLLYAAPESDDFEWMSSTDGTLSTTRPDEPVTLQLVYGVDTISSQQFFVPEALLSFQLGRRMILNISGSIANTLHCNDSTQNGCSYEWPEWYWPALPNDWQATLINY